MKTIDLPRSLLIVWEYDLIGDGVTLKLKHEVFEWLFDRELEYTTTMPNVRGPLGTIPRIHFPDDRDAMLFKLTWL